MSNKQEYIEFCKKEQNIPIFLQPWWLDSTCKEENWDVILVKQGNNIIASMPIYKEKKYIFDYITLPRLTQFMGVYIKYPANQKYSKRLHYEKVILKEIINKLPKFDAFIQIFHYDFKNWLPFYWAGFKQTTHYTYVIEEVDLDKVYANFSKSVKKEIKKAEKNGIVVVNSEDIKEFYRINSITYDKQGIEVPHSFEYIKNLYEKAKENNSVIMKFAMKNDEILSVSMAFKDSKSLYTVVGSSDRNKELYGAEYLLDWHLIQEAINSGLKFDFEGSIMERVESRVRSFGAVQKPYFQITKTDSTILKLKNCIKELLNATDIYH